LTNPRNLGANIASFASQALVTIGYQQLMDEVCNLLTLCRSWGGVLGVPKENEAAFLEKPNKDIV